MENNEERKWKLYCHTNKINGKLYLTIQYNLRNLLQQQKLAKKKISTNSSK